MKNKKIEKYKYFFLMTGCLKNSSSFTRFQNLGEQLSLLGIPVTYLCEKTEYNEILASKLNFASFQFLPSIKILWPLYVRNLVQKNKENITVLHILNPSPKNTFNILLYPGLLAIDFDELLSVRAINFIERISHSICEFFSLKKATLTIVSSLYLQSYFKSKFNIQSVYLPYAAYLQIPEIGENPFTCPTAVYMGNLHPDGDHDILLDAWSILKKQGKDLNLCMIGGGSRLESFRAEVRKRKLDSLITVMGYLPTSEMWNRLCHAHILLFPIRDTIGNRMRCPSKTFAYMQAGRPIVTCRVGEVPKALGEQGIYIEPKPEAFAKKVTEIFSQPVSNINYNLELHSWQYRAEELLTAIEGKS